MEVPSEYEGREQSFLKHRVLAKYLERWGAKVGSISQNQSVRLWFVDCFAGPWRSQHEKLTDTSIHIGLSALEDAGRIWRERGKEIELKAVFVEKEPQAYEALRKHLSGRSGVVDTIPLQGEFGEKVDEIGRLLGADPAFIFVDPTGFKGVAMDYLLPLLRPRMRDVLVNVMFNDINRFKDDERAFLRKQIREFFGLKSGDLEPGLGEEELLRTYRRQLKEQCGVRYAADLAIRHPTIERTWFRLVVGGKHPDVLRVFRDVESQVVGAEGSRVRLAARTRGDRYSGQISIFDKAVVEETIAPDPGYSRENLIGKTEAVVELLESLSGEDGAAFGKLWPV